MFARELQTDDRSNLAALFLASGWKAEAESIRENRDGPKGADVLRRWVVGDDDLVGYARLGRSEYEEPGLFSVELLVHPDSRKLGYGRALWRIVADEACYLGATSFRASVRDNDPCALAFAERRGFVRDNHLFESVLDLETFDATPFSIPEGLRVFSMADVPDDEIHRRKLWRLNDYDIDENMGGGRSFEKFVHDVFQGYWYRPEGQIVATLGDDWVGLAAVGMTGEGKGYHMMTGTVPAFRRRGVATALKLATIEWARRAGVREIWTHNDSQNAAMLSINRRLGYRPMPGLFRLKADLAP